MSQRAMLVQSLLGHLALLEQKHPKKARSAVAKAVKRCLLARDSRKNKAA